VLALFCDCIGLIGLYWFAMSSSEGPSELELAKKWDRCAEHLLKRTVLGFVVTLPVLLIAKRGWIRGTAIGLGTGIGVGSGAAFCQYEFAHPNLCHHTKVYKTVIHPPPPPEDTAPHVDSKEKTD